jgi:NAD(P)-dependent dehydrogenase (short-subunit alcohol dehydrogenase family)
MSLSGKVAVVTGGATGIGFATAKVLVERGARVAIAQLEEQRGREAAQRLGSEAAESFGIDIRDRASVEKCFDAVMERWGAIDVLVNNASVTGREALASFVEASEHHLDHLVDTNLKGTVYCSQAAARHMIESHRGGSIIHVSSVGAYAAQENAAIYCATKAAQVMLAKAMAIELGRHGIRVNCIAPGDIHTETSANAVDDIKRSGASGQFLRATPQGRRGCPEEIARAIAFLASDDASFITGTTLVVDGGFLAY